LNQKLFWENPSKMPSPAEWVTVRRIRVTPSVEQIWWLSPSTNPKANNANALRPYSESMQRRLAEGGERTSRRRPSGHLLKQGAFVKNNGGSIAHSLLTAAHTSSNDEYQRAVRAAGLPVHPARFPAALPEFLIRLLTDPGDHVVDFFAGSTMTGSVAEALKRRWTTIEKALAYGVGGMMRFPIDVISSVNEELCEAAFQSV
jgi:site-specific DNA-methyltransferase (cytosine-N4-specific)